MLLPHLREAPMTEPDLEYTAGTLPPTPAAIRAAALREAAAVARGECPFPATCAKRPDGGCDGFRIAARLEALADAAEGRVG